MDTGSQTSLHAEKALRVYRGVIMITKTMYYKQLFHLIRLQAHTMF